MNAIDIVRQMVANGQVSQEVAEKYFPELKERDGWKIRERLIAFLSQCKAVYGDSFKQFELNIDEALAWLDKQHEQQLDGTFVNVDDVREDFMNEVYRVLDADPNNDRANQIIDAFDSLPIVAIEKQGEQAPNLDVVIPFGAKDSDLQEASYIIPNGYHAEIEDNKVVIKKGEHNLWGEEDEKIMKEIIADVRFEGYNNDLQAISYKKINWLISIKYRVQSRINWKPSEEMLEALYRATPKNVMALSEDEMLLDKLYQGLKYGILSKN